MTDVTEPKLPFLIWARVRGQGDDAGTEDGDVDSAADGDSGSEGSGKVGS